jgi:hypothetical protein
MIASFKKLVRLGWLPRKRGTVVRSSSSRSSLKVQPAVESLGERIVPATFVVTNVHESGVGSLAAAIHHAEADRSETPEVITFSHRMAGKTITTAATLSVADRVEPIEIEAPSAGVIIDGGLAHEVFHIAKGTNVTLKNLTIEHGLSDNGGGIDNAGTLKMVNTRVEDNQARSLAGGIENEVSGKLSLVHCEVESNEAETAGGVDNRGAFTMSDDSTVVSNTATVSDGGGVENETGGRMRMLDDSSVDDNAAAGTGGGIDDRGTLTSNGEVNDNSGQEGTDDVTENHGGSSGSESGSGGSSGGGSSEAGSTGGRGPGGSGASGSRGRDG